MSGSEHQPADIVVSEDVVGPAMDELREQFAVHENAGLWQEPEELAEALGSARALIVRNRTKVTAAVLEQATELVIVGRAGAGLDNVDMSAASALGVVVSYAPVQNATSVAEHTLALMLALLRRIPQADSSVRQGQWLRQKHTGGELAGRTLGIIGLGNSGRRVAGYGRALGMRVIASDPYLSPDSTSVTELECQLVALPDLLAQADVVTVHVPLTDETRHLLGRGAFEQMKNSAVLVNAARGEIVDEAALCGALESGQIAGAALDVREGEPPSPDSPLHLLDNTVLTPHIAAFTTEAQDAVVAAVAADVAAVLNGRDASNHANFPRPRR